jgi:hypothetical protein
MEEKLRRLSGGKGESGFSESCSPELREKILESMLAFEEAPQVRLFEELEKGGLSLPAPDDLDDAQLNAKLWEVIRGMSLLGAYLYHTDHLSDRELYCLLWAELLREETVIRPVNPGFAEHIDIVGSGSKEDIELYLKYYADEDERLSWADDCPDTALPDRETPPFKRDELLPQAPFKQPRAEGHM